MENPFKTDGLVWSNGKGMLLLDGIAFPLTNPPVFTFSYQSLYCEPTLVKRVVRDKDYPLTEEEIAEVLEYLEEEKSKPVLVNGVDKDGKYLHQVRREEVDRVVREGPPPVPSKMWRLNPSHLFEYWDEVYPVDKDGYLLDPQGIVDDTQYHDIIKEPIPQDTLVRKWRWDFNASKWIDGDVYENKIKVLQERKIEEFKVARGEAALEQTVEYKGKTFNSSRLDLVTLTSAITIGVPSINWYPKGEIEPVKLLHADMKELAMLIFNAQQGLFQEYFTHKKAILSTVEHRELEAHHSKRDETE